MFCPRCGRNLNGDEYVCPECGNMLREPPQSQVSHGNEVSRTECGLFFILGLVSLFLLSYFVGFYFLFFFIPIFITGGRRSRSTMLFIGAMLGTVLGLVFKLYL